MDLHWVMYGTMPPRKRIAQLRRARIYTLERLADAQMRIEGLKADLMRIDGALADYGADSCMLGGIQGGGPNG